MQFHPCGSTSLPQACSTDGSCDFVFGVRWKPVEFLQQAVMAGHPFEQFSGLLPEVRTACEKLASMQSYEIVNLRCSKLGTWVRRMRALKLDEERLKASMPPGRAGILSSKRLLLMREIILDESYDDCTLADDLEMGSASWAKSPHPMCSRVRWCQLQFRSRNFVVGQKNPIQLCSFFDSKLWRCYC